MVPVCHELSRSNAEFSEQSHYLVEEGTLDHEIRDSLTAVIAAVKDLPGFHKYWQQRRAIFFLGFQQFVDDILASEQENSEGLYQPKLK
ncbi:MAG: hypothetical protein AAF431_08020 [Pseudomonadota bacterium]